MSKETPKARQTHAGAKNLADFHEGGGNTKHGIYAALETGQVPPVPDAAAITERVDSIVGEMVSDLGGDSELTAQRKAILESQRMCLLVLGLANGYLRREGLLNERGKPHPLLAVVVSFANSLRLNSLALGLERKTKTTPGWEERLLVPDEDHKEGTV